LQMSGISNRYACMRRSVRAVCRKVLAPVGMQPAVAMGGGGAGKATADSR